MCSYHTDPNPPLFDIKPGVRLIRGAEIKDHSAESGGVDEPHVKSLRSEAVNLPPCGTAAGGKDFGQLLGAGGAGGQRHPNAVGTKKRSFRTSACSDLGPFARGARDKADGGGGGGSTQRRKRLYKAAEAAAAAALVVMLVAFECVMRRRQAGGSTSQSARAPPACEPGQQPSHGPAGELSCADCPARTFSPRGERCVDCRAECSGAESPSSFTVSECAPSADTVCAAWCAPRAFALRPGLAAAALPALQ
eukprot:SAG11_NODE_2216_length_3680_cov_1.815415_3_plen_250_part_00